jgi:hypothetical protein
MLSGKDYSRINQGRKELINHIFVSSALVYPVAGDQLSRRSSSSRSPRSARA